MAHGTLKCDLCGKFVTALPDGRTYDDNGKWHKDTCKPDANYMNRRKVQKSDFAAKHMKIDDDRREDRGFRPLYPRGFRG